MGESTGVLVRLVAQARRAAQRRGQRATTAHVLLVMLQEDAESGAVLSRRGVAEGRLLTVLKDAVDEPPSAMDLAVERAEKIADALGDVTLRPIHLLLAVTKDPRSAAHRCLESIGQGVAHVREEARSVLGMQGEGRPPSATKLPIRRTPRPGMAGARQPTMPRARRVPKGPEEALRDVLKDEPVPPVAKARGHEASGTFVTSSVNAAANDGTRDASPEVDAGLLDPEIYPVLSALGRNLTDAARGGRIDPVVGRDAEIEQVLDVLVRRRANNPILVGPPGVGKTAVVEGVARKLALGAGEELAGKIVVEISAGGLVSGTSVRGALAERMRRIREEVARSEGRILLFIDEIHAVMGGTDGPDDLSQELKSSLARGELTCIGATTDAEYRKHFEKDPALARRFSAIRVAEPSPELALTILRGLAPKYEVHHGVRYAEGTLEATVSLSVRYLTERQLPDKAVSLLDLAAARVRRRGGTVVDVAAIAQVVAEQADVPVERILDRDSDRLLRLEEELSSRIVGHGDVIHRIAEALRKGAAGFRGQRPLGTFLLLGPTGVGKTEMAKAVADVLFAGGAMTRLDMSEFSEAHSVARMLGAPPGYVGHDDGGQLTEAVRRRPYQLILLDEIEKAHPDVLLALLPLLDEGRLTDARGRLVDFTNTIIFMTSNLGAEPTAVTGRIGFGTGAESAPPRASDRALQVARTRMPPELWNRIDEPLYFAPLDKREVREIASRLLTKVSKTLSKERGVSLVFDSSVLDTLIAAGGFDASLGARPMRRTIGRLVESPLAAKVLSGEIPRGAVVTLRGVDDAIVADVQACAAE